MSYDEAYFRNQIRKSDDKVAWQYGSLVAFACYAGRPNLRVLDAGCGAGPGLRYLTSRGYRTFGTDLVEYPLTVAHQSVPSARLAESDLNVPLPFASASFDVILLSEVIEHLENVRAVFRECLRVLVIGGAVVATTPNLWDIRKYWQGERWSGYIDKTHRHLFNPRSLGTELRTAGFGRVRVKSGFKPLIWLSSRKLRFRLAIPGLPYIGNTLIAVGYKDQ